MPKHIVLPIDASHFDHWLELFKTTVEELCLPEDAELFMKKATQIAHSLEMGVAYKNNVMLKVGERYRNNNGKTHHDQ